MEIFIGLVIIVLTLLAVYWKYLQSYWSRLGIPYEPPSFPTGNLKGWRTSKHLIDIMTPIYNKHKGTGPFVGMYFTASPVALALDLGFVQNVLVKDFNNFENRGVFYNERDDPLSAHLFALDAKTWRPLRQKLSPTFTSGKMKCMFPMVVKVGAELAQVFTEKLAAAENGVLAINDVVGSFTADVIGSCAFGLECNSLRNPDAEFVKIGKSVAVELRHNKLIDTFINSFPDLARKLRMRQLSQKVHDFYMGITKNTVEYREKNNVKRDDFMDMLINLKNKNSDDTSGLTMNEIASQSFIFFFAGFETSSTTMSFALYELARNQHIQDKLRQEVNESIKRHNNEISYECVQDMRYMEKVISETLRKYPILPQLQRKSTARYETGDPKYYLEAGTTVVIPVHSIHFDPEIYPEPEKFDPERYSEAEIKKRPACSFLPFGDGPRNCIGLRFGRMQAAVGLAYLIKNFKFNTCDRTQPKMKFNIGNILLSSEIDIHLRAEKVQ